MEQELTGSDSSDALMLNSRGKIKRGWEPEAFPSAAWLAFSLTPSLEFKSPGHAESWCGPGGSVPSRVEEGLPPPLSHPSRVGSGLLLNFQVVKQKGNGVSLAWRLT